MIDPPRARRSCPEPNVGSGRSTTEDSARITTGIRVLSSSEGARPPSCTGAGSGGSASSGSLASQSAGCARLDNQLPATPWATASFSSAAIRARWPSRGSSAGLPGCSSSGPEPQSLRQALRRRLLSQPKPRGFPPGPGATTAVVDPERTRAQREDEADSDGRALIAMPATARPEQIGMRASGRLRGGGGGGGGRGGRFMNVGVAGASVRSPLR